MIKNEYLLLINTQTMYAARYKGKKHTGEITHINQENDGEDRYQMLFDINSFLTEGWAD